MSEAVITRPGRELPKVWRDLATRLVREQGWSYRYKREGGSHPRVIPPDGGLGVALPTTVTDGHAGHRASYLTALKRAGADLSEPPPKRRRRTVTPASDDADMATIAENLGLSDSEWRQRFGDNWWQVRYQGAAPETAKPVGPARTPSRAELQAQRVLAALDKYTPRRQPTVDMDCQDRGADYTLGQVRTMFREGYPLKYVVRQTGWGAYWLADMAGDDGYCLPEYRNRNGRTA